MRIVMSLRAWAPVSPFLVFGCISAEPGSARSSSARSSPAVAASAEAAEDKPKKVEAALRWIESASGPRDAATIAKEMLGLQQAGESEGARRVVYIPGGRCFFARERYRDGQLEEVILRVRASSCGGTSEVSAARRALKAICSSDGTKLEEEGEWAFGSATAAPKREQSTTCTLHTKPLCLSGAPSQKLGGFQLECAASSEATFERWEQEASFGTSGDKARKVKIERWERVLEGGEREVLWEVSHKGKAAGLEADFKALTQKVPDGIRRTTSKTSWVMAEAPECRVESRHLPKGWTWDGSANGSPGPTRVSAVEGAAAQVVHAAAGTLSGPKVTSPPMKCEEFKAALAKADGPSVLTLAGECGPFDVERSGVTILGGPGARITCAKDAGKASCAKPGHAELVHVGRYAKKGDKVDLVEDVAIVGLTFERFRSSTPGADAIALSVLHARRVLLAGNAIVDGGVSWNEAHAALSSGEHDAWRTSSGYVPPKNDRDPPPRVPGNFNAAAIKAWRGSDRLVVFGNTIDGMDLAYSEAIALVEGTNDFRVLGNVVAHVDNIGIDVRGDADGVSHDGAICFNELRDFRCGNPAYSHEKGAPCASGPAAVLERERRFPNAGGIYIDGGRSVLVRGNRVNGWDYGVQVSREAIDAPPRGVHIVDNILVDNRDSAIHLGFRKSGNWPGDCGTVIGANETSGTWAGAAGSAGAWLAPGIFAAGVSAYGCDCRPLIGGESKPAVCESVERE